MKAADIRKKYIEFFENFGVNLKYGVYDKYGLKKDLLQDLILFKICLKTSASFFPCSVKYP